MISRWCRTGAYALSAFLWQQAAAAQPVAGPPTEARAAVAPDYRINPGDELQIHVWGDQRLQAPVRVLPDGKIAFPLVGTLVAQGLRPEDLQVAISNGLRGQYRGDVPQVTVSVVSPSGLQFSILGRVRSPGNFTPGRYVNVLEALSLAGGPNEFANLDNVLIIRKVGDQLRSFRVSLSGLFRGGSDASNAVGNIIRLETGDTIIVP